MKSDRIALVFVLAGSALWAQSGATANISGNWNITAHSTSFGDTFQIAGQINQSGGSLSGQLSVAGSICAQTATFTGTISANGSITINLNESGQVVVFSGTVSADGNSASGTYSAPSGGCTSGDSGTWVGIRPSIISYPVGSQPYYAGGIAFDGANIWVTNGASNTVTKLLASTGTIVGTYPAGYRPTLTAPLGCRQRPRGAIN